MKNFFLFLLFIPLFSFNSNVTDNSIIGKWEGTDEKNKVGSIVFNDDGYATIQIEDQTFGGKEFEIRGNKASMTYSINKDVEPIEIDFIITSLETQTEMRILMIAKFAENDIMTIASDFNDLRPTEFNSGNSIKLHRIK